MLHRGKVIAALEAKAGQFAGYENELADVLEIYEQALVEMSHLSREELETRLAGIPWPGARPTAEHDLHPGVVVPFGSGWTNHEQARGWALDVLAGVTTAAVDGSQITPTKDVSMPVGAVQIGWFVNPHTDDVRYVKDVTFDVLPPDELAGEEEEGFGFPDWRINLRRFAGECHKLIELMAAHRDAEVRPVCFFDGSLVVSFVQPLRPERQREYVRAVMDLLAASERYRVPLVGYVDTSYANDLLVMLNRLAGKHGRPPVGDGAVLRSRMGWGDRTTAWICAREDDVLPLGGEKYYDRVCFLYLKTTADRPPARLDLPRWVVEGGELERVMDVVRAECVVGNGYPYALETADAVAVITRQDRERFYRVFQEFAEREGLPLRFARKAVSKRGRRA
jgi:hypothetical protein